MKMDTGAVVPTMRPKLHILIRYYWKQILGSSRNYRNKYNKIDSGAPDDKKEKVKVSEMGFSRSKDHGILYI
jgi:hypothetical protein